MRSEAEIRRAIEIIDRDLDSSLPIGGMEFVIASMVNAALSWVLGDDRAGTDVFVKQFLDKREQKQHGIVPQSEN